MGRPTGLNHLLSNHYCNLPIYVATLAGLSAPFAWNYFLRQLMPTASVGGPHYTGTNFNCDRYTTGNLLYGLNFTGDLYIYGMDCTHLVGTNGALTDGANQVSTTLYDRLWHCSGFSYLTSGVQTIPTPGILPARDMYKTSSGIGCEIWVESFSQPSTLTFTTTVTYTDHLGNTGITGQMINNLTNFVSGSCKQLTMPQNGVSSIQSVQLSTTGAISGNFGLFIMNRICELPNFIGYAKNISAPLLYFGINALNSGCYSIVSNSLFHSIGASINPGIYNFKLAQL